MPNHVRTTIKFRNLKKKDDFEFILRMIARPLEPDDLLYRPDYEGYHIDFDKIIPQPRTKEECPERYLRTEFSGVEEEVDRPWFDWYKWNCDNWGTKWGAYDGCTEMGKSYILFCFSTAWSLAVPIVNKLTVLGYDFEVKFADEDLGANCGWITYDAKTNTMQRAYEYEAFVNPRKWAQKFWDRY